jgi:dihydroneopterin aldolase
VVVEVAPAPAPLNDDVDRILSYDRITWAIAHELAAERLNLLETLAERVAERILAEPQAMRAFVRIEKLDVGPYKLGVEIVRSRAEVPLRVVGTDGAEAVVHPVVAYLDAAAIADQGLPLRLDALLARGAPLIVTVGLPDAPRPVTGHRPTQRRIDLLAIEQLAWQLAARDARCVVVATRTEIDWAMKRGQTVVWAPSKMVLDSVDGPKSADPLALALWLAEQVSARALVIHADVTHPAGSRVPVEIG